MSTQANFTQKVLYEYILEKTTEIREQKNKELPTVNQFDRDQSLRNVRARENFKTQKFISSALKEDTK